MPAGLPMGLPSDAAPAGAPAAVAPGAPGDPGAAVPAATPPTGVPVAGMPVTCWMAAVELGLMWKPCVCASFSAVVSAVGMGRHVRSGLPASVSATM